MRKFLHDLTDITVKTGYSGYRTHVGFMDEVTAHHSFENHASTRVKTSLKDILDPNGIWSPGKSGAWNSKIAIKRAFHL